MAENGTASKIMKVFVSDLCVHVEKKEDQKQGNGHNHDQPFPDPLRGLVIAAPIVGGVFTSFLLELLVYPAIYQIWRWDFGLKKHLARN